MPSYLILKLQGAMQAWGSHTYEDYRPSLIFPTRSAVVGLLGACLGLERERPCQLKSLSNSFELTVLANLREVDQRHLERFKLTELSLNQLGKEALPDNILANLKKIINQKITGENKFLTLVGTQIGQEQMITHKEAILKHACLKRPVTLHKMTDYHTILDARRSDGGKRDDAIVSRREYLCDAEFTLALSFKDQAPYDLETIVQAVKKPHYTPYLGRRSCPLHRPLFDSIVSADTAEQALRNIHPEGTLYSETPLPQSRLMPVRDLPLFTEKRRFVTRSVYVVGS
jgi:CRISPR system Cascade subunit CasD